MKKFINILLAAAVTALAVASCQKEEQVKPGTPDPEGCYGVYFPVQEASGSHTYDPDMDRSVTITVARTNTNGAITVPYSAKTDADGVFVFSDIVFADGQAETELEVTFDAIEEGKTSSFSLVLDDNNAYVSHYNSGAIALDFSVIVVKWEDFLNPKTNEPAVFTINSRWNGMFGPIHATLKYYEVNGIRTGVFTSIDTDEEGNLEGFWHSVPEVTLNMRWYTQNQNSEGYDFVELPKQYFGYDYNDGNWLSVPLGQAADPIFVYDYPWYWVERGYAWGQDGMGANWLDEANKTGQMDGSYPVSYYDGNGAFFFNIYFYIPGLGGWSPDNYGTVAIADGFVRVDYSLELVTDFSQEGVTPVYVEAGADIASLKYAVFEGELNSVQTENQVKAIVAGEVETTTYSDLEFDEEEAKNYGAFGIAPETSGAYTVVVVAYDAEDEAQASASIVVDHVSAADTEAKQVKISVFTEPTPARYTSFTEYDSFAFGVGGSEITEAHISVLPTSKVNAAAINNLKYSGTPVSADILEEINGEGGYYDVVGGLDAGTSYTVLVWATNGALDTVVYSTFETTANPEVWKSLGTGSYTEDFFTTFFNVDPVTMDVEIMQSEDDPTRYKMVYPYDEKYVYNDPGDWDTSKSYDIVFTIPDANHVYIVPQEIGVNWGYGMFSIASTAGRYIASGYDIATLDENEIPFGEFKDGVVTFSAEKSLLISMADYNNGGFYYANSNGAFKIVLPAGAAPAAVSEKAQKPSTVVIGGVEAAPVKHVFEREVKAISVPTQNLNYSNRTRKENKQTRCIANNAVSTR